MALGLIQFLLGGKNKKATSKNKEGSNNNSNPQRNVTSNDETNQNSPSSTSTTQASTTNDESTNQPSQQNQNTSPVQQNKGNKKSVSEILMKMHKEMKDSNERLTTVVTDVKKIENAVNSLSNRVDMIEKKDVEKETKLKEIDSNMGQFLSLYELINNQYNPFVSKEDMPKMETSSQREKEPEENNVSPIEIETSELEEQKEENLQDNSNGTALEFAPEDNVLPSSQDREKAKEEVKTITLPQEEKPKSAPQNFSEGKEKPNHKMSQSLLELDTLNIEEAAADAVPLTKLKNNTNALVIILSWLEFLIKRVGINETRNTLRYYTETLRWMTPEVFFDLDKYLKGMSDSALPQNSKANVKDHIVSLYFISKLNEKSLDHRLTKAVLEIIDQ